LFKVRLSFLLCDLLRSLVRNVFLSLLLLDSYSSSFSNVLTSDLLSNILRVVLEFCETSIVDKSHFLLTFVLSNFLVEVSEPKDNSRLVSNTLLVDTFVVLSSFGLLDFLESTEHWSIHLKVGYLELLDSVCNLLKVGFALFSSTKLQSLVKERICWSPVLA